MRKKMLSLLCVLALCLGLLPVTALAADGIELYVGGQLITESGCYEKNQDGNWTKVDNAEPASGQFYYDAATATLTLNQAKIVNYQDVTVGGGFTYPGSVIAFSQSADVSLTIEVSQGTSNITGTGGIRVVSKAGDASLSISGPGSLEVKNVSNDSGIVLIGSKNVNLGINSADVTISNVQYYGVQLAAGDECKSTATINDGNLTVSDSVVGIYFMRLYTSGPSSLTVSGNAMVDTEGRTGGIINGFPDSFQIGADGESGGIVFNGNSGTVYGNVTLQEDLEIGTDETLTIGKDASLTVPENVELTNNGKINNSGKLTGIIEGNQPPKITTTSLSEGTVNTAYNQPLAADNNPTSWSVTNGTLPDGLTLNSDGTITGTPTAAGASTFTVTATNDSGSDSKEYTLTIAPKQTVSVTGVSLNKTSTELTVGQSETLTATVEPSDATNKNVTWSTSDARIATVTDGVVTAVSAGTATITVTTEDGGFTANCTVTVRGDVPDRPVNIPDTHEIELIAGEGGEAKTNFSNAGAGTKITVTATPDEGYELAYITVDGERIDGTTFKMPAHDVTVRVYFTGGALPFADVNSGAWYYDAVSYVCANGLMDGVSASEFAPEANMTRAMFWTILARIDGEAITGTSWAEAARAWATESGVSDGTDPNGLVTREQFATMLYRYAGEPAAGSLSAYTDAESVSEWATDAMLWATQNGIITGTTADTLAPQSTATRAQCAAMLMRFAER